LLVAVLGAVWRRPAVIHCLWLLVLVKLITPPLVPVPIPPPSAWWPVTTGSASTPPSPAPSAIPKRPPTPPPPPLKESPVGKSVLPRHERVGPGAVEASAAHLDPIAVETAPISDRAAAAAPETEYETAPRSIPWASAILAIWISGSLGWLALVVYRV